MNEFEIQRLLQSLNEINNTLRAIGQNMGSTTKQFAKESGDAAKEANVAWMKSFPKAELERAFSTYIDTSISGFDKFANSAKAAWDGVKNSISSALGGVDPFKNLKSGLKGAMEGNSARTMIEQFTAGMPFGGLISMMLYGRNEQLKFGALGQKAAQEMLQAGAVGKGVAGDLAGEIRRLSVASMAGEEDLKAIASSFAGMGFKANEVRSSLSGWSTGVKGLGANAMTATLQLDTMFQLGAGTAAKQAASLALTSNATLADSIKIYKDISFAAREAGVSQQSFVGSVLQASSALRMQHADTKALSNALLKMQEGFKQQGLTSQAAGAMATSGIGAIAGGISGMSQGLTAFIGEKVSARMGGDLKGVDALIEMQRGFRGQEGSERTFALTIMELLSETRRIGGGNERKQEFALQGLGFSVEASQSLIALQRGAKSEEDLMEKITTNSGDLQRAFKNEALKTNTFEAEMKQLRDAIARLGVDLLTILVGGFRTLELLGKATVAILAKPTAASDIWDIISPELLKVGQGTQAAFGSALTNSLSVAEKVGAVLDTATLNKLVAPNDVDAKLKKRMKGGIVGSGTDFLMSPSPDRARVFLEELLSPEGAKTLGFTKQATDAATGDTYEVQINKKSSNSRVEKRRR